MSRCPVDHLLICGRCDTNASMVAYANLSAPYLAKGLWPTVAIKPQARIQRMVWRALLIGRTDLTTLGARAFPPTTFSQSFVTERCDNLAT